MIKTRLTERFGIKYPIISAPMGPFYTTELTIATSEAGGLGVLSHATLQGKNSVQDMKVQIERVIEHTDKPFGVNVRVARVQTDHKIMLRKIMSWREKNPKFKEQLIYILTSAGGTSFATGVEGGGHQSYEEITTLVLLQEIVNKYPNVPVIACGGIASPEGIAACLAGGADAIAMGTRFIASRQSEFHPNYKDLIPSAEDRDTILTTGGFGPIRLLKNKYALKHGNILSKEEKIAQEMSFSMEEYLEDLKHYELVYTVGDVEDGAIPAGQSVGLISNLMDVDDIVQGFTKKAEEILRNLSLKIQ
ncbi:MAG: nitronate monooxygenase [Candidatus Lokiarchaeota archaeon]